MPFTISISLNTLVHGTNVRPTNPGNPDYSY